MLYVPIKGRRGDFHEAGPIKVEMFRASVLHPRSAGMAQYVQEDLRKRRRGGEKNAGAKFADRGRKL